MSILDYKNQVDLNSSNVQHTLGTRIAHLSRFDADQNPLSVMRGMNSEDLDDTTEHAIQVFTVAYKKGGRFTKYAQQVSQYGVQYGDGPLDADDTESYGEYSFTVSPQELNTPKGFEIGTQFKNGIVAVGDVVKVEHHMMKWAKQTTNELAIIKLSGRIGRPSRQGFSGYKGDEIGYDALGQNTVRTTAASYRKINENGDFYENSDVFNPAQTDFRNNPKAHPALLTNDHTMSYDFLKNLNSRLKLLQNEQYRGVPWLRPMINTMDKYDQTLQTGGSNRLMVGGGSQYMGALILSEEAINDFKEDPDWIAVQRNYTMNSGMLSGIFTGILGDIDGMKICSMLKMVNYAGGADGSVDVHRGLILGGQSAVEILCNFPQMPEQMTSNVKNYQKQYMDTPASASIRVNPTNTGKKQSIWMTMYYNIVQAAWEVNYRPPNSTHTYDRVSNVIAVDVASANRFV